MDWVGLLVVAAVLVIGVAVGWWRRRTDGRLRPVPARGEDRQMPVERLDDTLLAALGVAPAEATLLQFSSAFCAPCRAVRRVSSEVAALLPGVRHVEVDAESHLDAVRALGIWRTPTLLVLDGDGRVAKRATGVPAKPQLIAVLGEILPAG
jgi:thiol-disulfide isomerase/thioredoxin